MRLRSFSFVCFYFRFPCSMIETVCSKRGRKNMCEFRTMCICYYVKIHGWLNGNPFCAQNWCQTATKSSNTRATLVDIFTSDLLEFTQFDLRLFLSLHFSLEALNSLGVCSFFLNHITPPPSLSPSDLRVSFPTSLSLPIYPSQNGNWNEHIIIGIHTLFNAYKILFTRKKWKKSA